MDYFEYLDDSRVSEDEEKKQQSLQEFRELLKNHQFIRKCRQDDTFLLQFLRKRKFSVDAAMKTFENNLKLRKKHPEWFDTGPIIIERFKAMVGSGFSYALKNCDSDGTRLVLVNVQKLDLKKFDALDIFRCAFLSTAIMHEYEPIQKMKISYVYNYKNTPMSFFTQFGIGDIIDWAKSTEVCPGRYKKVILIGLPPYANTLLNIIKMTMNKKLRSRLIFLNNFEELHQHVSPKILTSSFGGILPEEELIEENIKTIDEKLEKLKEANDFVIIDEYSKLQNSENENFGTFRKLEID